MRAFAAGLGALTLMCVAPVLADSRPTPPASTLPSAVASPVAGALPAVLAAFEAPSKAVVDALQRALDDGWPSGPDAVLLGEVLTRNAGAIEAFRHAVDGGTWVPPHSSQATLREALTRLRLAIAFLIIDGMRAASAGQTETAARDLQAAATVARTLVAVPFTPLRIVGFSACARAAAFARRAGLSLPVVALPSAADLVSSEKAQFLDAAEQAARLDGSLRPHVLTAAARLAETYYDPLGRPRSAAEAEALQERFVALYSELGSRYGEMEPRKVLELIPVPVPPPPRLGETVAAVVLCRRYLDTRQLLRLRDEAAKALGARQGWNQKTIAKNT